MNAGDYDIPPKKEHNVIVQFGFTLLLGAIIVGACAGVSWVGQWLYNNHIIILEGILVVFLIFVAGMVARMLLDV